MPGIRIDGWRVRRTANRAVRSARGQIKGRQLGDIAVAEVFHYGAVDIETRHLVVWVMLDGEPTNLPEWWAAADEPTGRFPDALEKWLSQLRDEVRAEFAKRSWPDAASVDVMFDSAERGPRQVAGTTSVDR
jgi:hypothetical protein